MVAPWNVYVWFDKLFFYLSQASVFNNYLGRMGVSETTCTERQCMLALGATSDELRKYPMVTSRLIAYAGPQCYPHLDRRSADYRVDVVERREEEKEKQKVAGEAKGASTDVLDGRCWLHERLSC